MILVDGSEGGGQMLRTALTLSGLTQKPFRMINIRKGRTNPGLKQQHIAAIKSVSKICGAQTSELHEGVQSIEFIPNKVTGKSFKIDVGTAGSVTLVLQSVLPLLLFSERRSTVQVTGGTDTRWCPQADYFINVFLPQMHRYGKIDARIIRRGYYPAGNGNIIVKIKPKYPTLASAQENSSSYINLTSTQKVLCIKGVSHASKSLSDKRVALRQANAAKIALNGYTVEITSEYCDTASFGSGITLWSMQGNEFGVDNFNPIILGADQLGEKGTPAEEVGESAAHRLLACLQSGACVDDNLADQLLIYMALFPGCAIKTSRISDHMLNNIKAIGLFLPTNFKIDEKNNKITSS
jgi:RNA 3'-terminal phosphate cyclase (ATP)